MHICGRPSYIQDISSKAECCVHLELWKTCIWAHGLAPQPPTSSQTISGLQELEESSEWLEEIYGMKYDNNR